MATEHKKTTDTKELTAQGRVESSPAPAANAVQLKSELVRKITTKLFQKIELGIGNGVKIAGVIRGQRQRTGTYGEYTAFIGTFRAIVGNIAYASTELILPAFPEAILRDGYASAFNSLPKDSVKGAEATFAFKIWRKDDSADTKNARGFTWEVEQIMTAAAPQVENDPLLKLLA